MKKMFLAVALVLSIVSFGWTANLLSPRNKVDNLNSSSQIFKRGYFTDISVGGVNYTWPSADGTNGYTLVTNGSGTLSWSSAGAATALHSIADPAGNGTIDQAGYKQIWTSTLNSAGAVWTFTNTTADLTADVSFIDFKYTDDGDANGFFMRGYDNAAGDLKWSIAQHGNAVFFDTTTNDLAVGGNTTMTGTLTVNGATMVGDGATKTSGFIRNVIAVGATNPYTMTIAECGSVFVTSQASHIDLIADPTGCEITLVVNHASAVEVDPNSTDIIYHTTGSGGKYFTSSTVGDMIKLVGFSTAGWAVEGYRGTWTSE